MVIQDGCRICLGDSTEGRFISPCKCKGTIRYVHAHCLEQWRLSSVNPRSYWECDQCKYKYSFQRTLMANLLRNQCFIHLLTLVFFLVCSLILGILIGSCSKIDFSFTSFFDYLLFHTIYGALWSSIVGFISLLCSLLFAAGFATSITLPRYSLHQSNKDINAIILIICIIIGFGYVIYHTYLIVSYLTKYCISKTEYLVENVS